MNEYNIVSSLLQLTNKWLIVVHKHQEIIKADSTSGVISSQYIIGPVKRTSVVKRSKLSTLKCSAWHYQIIDEYKTNSLCLKSFLNFFFSSSSKLPYTTASSCIILYKQTEGVVIRVYSVHSQPETQFLVHKFAKFFFFRLGFP